MDYLRIQFALKDIINKNEKHKRFVLCYNVNALLDCHDLALSCCREIARISVMEWSL